MTYSQLQQPRKSILIADDHIDTIETLRAFLPCAEYDVSIAFDGRRALEVANTRLPQYFLLDVALPKLTGFEVAQSLRQSHQFKESLIIGYSGFGGEKYYAQARSSGMDFYLLKPADPDVLISLLSPEKDPSFLLTNAVISLGLELMERSSELQAKAQALSRRSAEILKAAAEAIQRSRKVRISRRQTKATL